MPGGDGTGPNGMGPMTGRGAGNRSGAQPSGGMNAGRGQGMGRGNGRGGGGGARRMTTADFPVQQPESMPQAMPGQDSGVSELDALRSQAAQISQALDDINGRIAGLIREAGNKE